MTCAPKWFVMLAERLCQEELSASKKQDLNTLSQLRASPEAWEELRSCWLAWLWSFVQQAAMADGLDSPANGLRPETEGEIMRAYNQTFATLTDPNASDIQKLYEGTLHVVAAYGACLLFERPYQDDGCSMAAHGAISLCDALPADLDAPNSLATLLALAAKDVGVAEPAYVH